MSFLIKTGDATDTVARERHGIRDLIDPSLRRSEGAGEMPVPMLSPSDARIAALTEEVAILRESLRLEKERSREKAEAALEEGRRRAVEAWERDEAAALELLEARVTDAASRMAEAFDRAEQAGLALAQAALERVLGPDADRGGLIEEIVRHQMRRLRAEQVLAVHVSDAEFADGEGLSGLRTLLSARQADLVEDPSLQPGECRIRLRLGEMEVGPDVQWNALACLFAELAGE